MTVLEQLASVSDKHVTVFTSNKGDFCVSLEDAYISEDLGDSAEKQLYAFGCGHTVEEAAVDYIKQISGKTLGFTKSDKKWSVLVFKVPQECMT